MVHSIWIAHKLKLHRHKIVTVHIYFFFYFHVFFQKCSKQPWVLNNSCLSDLKLSSLDSMRAEPSECPMSWAEKLGVLGTNIAFAGISRSCLSRFSLFCFNPVQPQWNQLQIRRFNPSTRLFAIICIIIHSNRSRHPHCRSRHPDPTAKAYPL